MNYCSQCEVVINKVDDIKGTALEKHQCSKILFKCSFDGCFKEYKKKEYYLLHLKNTHDVQ